MLCFIVELIFSNFVVNKSAEWAGFRKSSVAKIWSKIQRVWAEIFYLDAEILIILKLTIPGIAKLVPPAPQPGTQIFRSGGIEINLSSRR